MRSQVKDPEMAEKLLPKYELGCKRITPSDTYLKSFNRPNVHLVTTRLDRFTSRGIKTADGQETEVDVVIFATGFNVQGSLKAYKVTGRHGRDLHTDWGDSPAAFNGSLMVR